MKSTESFYSNISCLSTAIVYQILHIHPCLLFVLCCPLDACVQNGVAV